jgi:hypothetical protein
MNEGLTSIYAFAVRVADGQAACIYATSSFKMKSLATEKLVSSWMRISRRDVQCHEGKVVHVHVHIYDEKHIQVYPDKPTPPSVQSSQSMPSP